MAAHFRPSLEDKTEDSRQTSIAGLPEADDPPARIEHGTEDILVLNEEEALIRARADPQSTVPIFVTFKHGDPALSLIHI